MSNQVHNYTLVRVLPASKRAFGTSPVTSMSLQLDTPFPNESRGISFQEAIMKDSWCKPYKTAGGARIAGAPARESRIAAEGGMDRIIAKHEMRGFRSGYDAGKEDTTERMHDLEARVTRLERGKVSSS
jgi:hypothetical protein